MSERLTDSLALRPVREWNLPSDLEGFLEWLRAAMPGISDEERTRAFREMSAYADMPKDLRLAVYGSTRP